MTTVLFESDAGSATWVALATTATVDCVGTGGAGVSFNTGGGGGGGGGFSRTAVTGLILGRSYHVRFAGNQVFFGPDTVAANALCLANNGAAGSSGTGGAGGSAGTAIGDTKRAGGNGGNGGLNAGGGGGASGEFTAAGSNGSNAAGGLGGAGGSAAGSADGGAGRDGDDPEDAESGGDPGAGGGGGSNVGQPGLGGRGLVSITFTAQLSLTDPLPDEDLKETAIVNKLLDPAEELSTTPGILLVAPASDDEVNAPRYFVGFDITLTVASTTCPFEIQDTDGLALWTWNGGLITNKRLFLRGLRHRVAAGKGIQIAGGDSNCILNGTVYWE